MGCGISAVACVLRTTYARARILFPKDIRDQDRGRGFTREEIRKALAKGGIDYRRRAFGSIQGGARWAAIPDRSIVFVRRFTGDGDGHYLVRDGDSWLDSMDSSSGDGTNGGGAKRRDKKLLAKRNVGVWKSQKTGQTWSTSSLPHKYRPMSFLAPV